MVGPGTLTFDISSVAVSTAVPGIAWGILFVLAWRHPGFAESASFGRRTFWLLLPGAILASLALLPIAPIAHDIVAISFAGAVFPLGVAVIALDRVAPSFGRRTRGLLVPLVAETLALLAVVVLADAGGLSGLAHALRTSSWYAELGLVTGLAVVAILLDWGLVDRAATGGDRAVVGTFALTSMVMVLTFAGARAIPGVGIAEQFPYYLLPPALAGVAAAVLAPGLCPKNESAALPLAFFAGGWGVALGADVLWQPPLYTSGPSGLYVVGGAGVLDLVYLSGFIALGAAWGSLALLGGQLEPVGTPLPPPAPDPSRRLREALSLASEGSVGPAVEASAAAAREAALQTQLLLGKVVPDPSRPWAGLGVPGWVVSDQANLESVARGGASRPGEVMRAFVTARALVRLGSALGRSRFASIPQRLLAFGVDSALLGAAAFGIFAGIIAVTPGNLADVLASVPFNAAIYGLVAGALVYFAASEMVFGATVGKSLVGIEVRDRRLRPVDGVASFLRNAPLLPVMTLYFAGLALAVAIALRGLAANATLAAFGLSAGAGAILGIGVVVLAGVALAGAIGVATIAVTNERQRVGDLWAGTWVVRRLSPTAVLPSPAGPAVRSG